MGQMKITSKKGFTVAELLIVVGDREAVAYMVRNEKKQKRFSGLRWRLRRTAR